MPEADRKRKCAKPRDNVNRSRVAHSMQRELSVSLDREALESGSEKERATFGLLTLEANKSLLTVGVDTESGELRQGPYIAAYPLAEWLVWNWWRLLWEPSRPSSPAAVRRWEFAHRMSTIGEGYEWPNITIRSDGVRTYLRSWPTVDPSQVRFHYLTESGQGVSTSGFQCAIRSFVDEVISRLPKRLRATSNLSRLWNDVQAECVDLEQSRFRRLEAQLGSEPGETDEALIRSRLDDAGQIGDLAMGEVAADGALHGYKPTNMLSAKDIATVASEKGFESRPVEARDLVNSAGDPPELERMEAWRVGADAAQEVREHQGLNRGLIPNKQLVESAGTQTDAISDSDRCSEGFSFSFDEERGQARIALRSRGKTERRFELARLIGDRLLNPLLSDQPEHLFPATRTHSYRQKAQRAFAAELLSPFNAVDEVLAGDYSEKKRTEASAHFDVPEWAIAGQLVRHERIGKEDSWG